jgi:hypothetical protein
MHTVFSAGIIVGHYEDKARAERVASYRGGLTGQRATVGKFIDTSIHPTKPLRTPRPGKSPATIARLRSALEEHCARHPNDALSCARLAALS